MAQIWSEIPLKLAHLESGVNIVRVELHATQISLGDIQDIQVGDVFDVPHALDEPLLAVSEHGIPIAQAYLGKSQSHKAIELLDQPLAPHSASTP